MFVVTFSLGWVDLLMFVVTFSLGWVDLLMFVVTFSLVWVDLLMFVVTFNHLFHISYILLVILSLKVSRYLTMATNSTSQCVIICVDFTNKSGSHITADKWLKEVPAQFTMQLEDTKIEPNEDVTFTCRVNKDVEVNWLIDSKEVPDSPKYDIKSKDVTHSLTIKDLHVDDLHLDTN
jgi:hypothetical protein